MPKISKEKLDKISEQILHYLFTVSPQSAFTNKIAEELVRDEEFIKSLLEDLQKSKLVIAINKNSNGKDYTKRRRWRLSNQAYEVYKSHQAISNKNNLNRVSSSASVDSEDIQ